MMEDLDELLWSSGGNGSLVTTADWQRIVDHTFSKLSPFFGMALRFSGEPSVGNGFFVSFESVKGTNDPFALRVRGTYGVDFPAQNTPAFKVSFIYIVVIFGLLH